MKTLRDIVAPSMTRREARSALKAAGWEFVGGGSFASVWGEPGGDRVAKVTKPDTGGEATYQVAIEHPDNPHLPTYFDRIPLSNGGAVFEVERLEPFHGWDDWQEAIEAAEGEPDYEAAYDALSDADADLFGCAGWDDHWRNAMKRADGTIVLTDYLADMNQLCDATVSSGQAEAGDFTDGSRRGSVHYPVVEFGEAA